mmetsp:Transcript_72107/g.143006  ORF Transcript_72107/g.143006 Transcript_72107/m.143006 type:complete len:255 (+) Transcript_72107:622-1386(+)
MVFVDGLISVVLLWRLLARLVHPHAQLIILVAQHSNGAQVRTQRELDNLRDQLHLLACRKVATHHRTRLIVFILLLKATPPPASPSPQPAFPQTDTTTPAAAAATAANSTADTPPSTKAVTAPFSGTHPSSSGSPSAAPTASNSADAAPASTAAAQPPSQLRYRRGLLLLVDTFSVDRKAASPKQQSYLQSWVAAVESVGFVWLRHVALPRSHALAFATAPMTEGELAALVDRAPPELRMRREEQGDWRQVEES